MNEEDRKKMKDKALIDEELLKKTNPELLNDMKTLSSIMSKRSIPLLQLLKQINEKNPSLALFLLGCNNAMLALAMKGDVDGALGMIDKAHEKARETLITVDEAINK